MITCIIIDNIFCYSGPRCIAKFDYDSPESGDLPFPGGAVIRLIEHVGGDWLKGELHGVTGIFPSSFVDIVEDVVSMNSSPAMNGTSSSGMISFRNNVVMPGQWVPYVNHNLMK